MPYHMDKDKKKPKKKGGHLENEKPKKPMKMGHGSKPKKPMKGLSDYLRGK